MPVWINGKGKRRLIEMAKHPAKDVQCMIGGCQEAWVGGSGLG